jgi:hypothetical protein
MGRQKAEYLRMTVEVCHVRFHIRDRSDKDTLQHESAVGANTGDRRKLHLIPGSVNITKVKKRGHLKREFLVWHPRRERRFVRFPKVTKKRQFRLLHHKGTWPLVPVQGVLTAMPELHAVKICCLLCCGNPVFHIGEVKDINQTFGSGKQNSFGRYRERTRPRPGLYPWVLSPG